MSAPVVAGPAGARVRRVVAVLLGALLLLGAGASGASAHTTIELLDPADGSRLAEAPSSLEVEFGEAIPLRDTAVRVALASGREVAEGPLVADDPDLPAHARGTFALPDDLGPGSYVVTVVAQGTDGHTVSNAFAFTVGDAPLVRTEGATSPNDAPALVLLTALAGFVTAAGLAAVGLLYVASWCWPGAERHPLLRSVVRAGVALLAAGTAADLVVLVAAQQSSVGAVLGTQAGRLLLLRAVGVVLVVLAARGWVRTADRAGGARDGRQNLLVLAALPLLLGVVGSSHAAGDPWSLVMLLAGCVHAAAAALWLGGLAWLWAASVDERTPAVAAGRFSRTALVCAATAVGTGVLLAYRLTQGGSWAVLTSGYGVVLGVKVVLVAVLLLLARRTHGRVAAARAEEDAGRDGAAGAVLALAPARARLSAALRVECAAGVAVLVAAGALSAVGPGA